MVVVLRFEDLVKAQRLLKENNILVRYRYIMTLTLLGQRVAQTQENLNTSNGYPQFLKSQKSNPIK